MEMVQVLRSNKAKLELYGFMARSEAKGTHHVPSMHYDMASINTTTSLSHHQRSRLLPFAYCVRRGRTFKATPFH